MASPCILIVDDTGFNRIIVEKSMSEMGYQVISVGSAKEGLEMLKANLNISAVVTDLHMPEMDGIQFYEAVRKLKRYNDQGPVACPPFILLTASSDTTMLKQAINMGFAEILAKPFNQERIKKVLTEVLHIKPTSRKVEPEAPSNDIKLTGTLAQWVLQTTAKINTIQSTSLAPTDVLTGMMEAFQDCEVDFSNAQSKEDIKQHLVNLLHGIE